MAQPNNLYLKLANSADLTAVLAQLAKNPDFSSLGSFETDRVKLQFRAPADTAYFAWDNVDSLANDWNLGGDLIYVGWLAQSLPGDTSGDGVVDAADYMAVKKNFGQALAGAANGDFDKSGTAFTCPWASSPGQCGSRRPGGLPCCRSCSGRGWW